MEKILEITEEYTTLTISIGTDELVEDEDLWVDVFPGDPASDKVEKTPYSIVNEWSEEETTERIIRELLKDDDLVKRLYRAIIAKERYNNDMSIVNVVCEAYKTNIAQIRSKTRKEWVVEARQLICYLLSKLRRVEDKRIGVIINRDRSTAYVSIKVIEDRVDPNQLFVRQDEKLNTLFDMVKDIENN